MARKGDVVITIRIDDKAAPAEIRKLTSALSRLNATGTKAAGGVGKANAQVGGLSAAGGSAGPKLGQLTAAFGAAFIGAQAVTGALRGVTSAVRGMMRTLEDVTRQVIMTADGFELMEKQLTTLTRSKAKAENFFEKIKEFASETPYQVKGLAQSFNMLYPVFKDKTLPMMKMIGDTAAGTGRSFEDTSSAMMRLATGDWGTEILRQLFVIKADLEGVFGPNGRLVVGQEEAFGKLQTLMEDRFGGMMVSMMDTVQGKISNLGDVTDLLAASIGEQLTPVAKEVLAYIIDIVTEIQKSGELEAAVMTVADAYQRNKDLLFDILGLLPEVAAGVADLVVYAGTLLDYMGEINREWQIFGSDSTSAVGGLTSALRPLLKAMIMIAEYLKGWVNMARELADVKEYTAMDFLTGKPIREIGTKMTAPGMMIDVVKASMEAEKALADIDVAREEAWFDRRAEERDRGRDRARELAAELPGGLAKPPPKKPGAKGKAGKRKPRAGEEYLLAQPGYTPSWEMEMGYDVGGVTDFTGELGDETEKSMTEALDGFFKEYDEGLAAAEKANARFANSMAGDIRSALEGTDAGQIFARRLGAAVEAALSDAIKFAMAKMALSQALSAIPVIGPFLGALMGFDKGAVVAPTPGGTPGVVGEGGVPEAVVPLDVDNLTTFIRGVSAGLKFPPAVVQVNVRGTDPWFVRAYESSRDGAANYYSRVH